MRTARKVLLTLAIVCALIVSAAALATDAYAGLKTQFQTDKVYPEVDAGPASIAAAVAGISRGDWLAATGMVTGVVAEGEIAFRNNNFLPIYLPNTENTLTLEGQPIRSTIETTGFWPSPRASQSKAIRS